MRQPTPPAPPADTAVPHRLELPTDFALPTVNVYLFTAPEPVLIDAGQRSEQGWEALVSGLAAHRLRVQDLEKVIITHDHIDHIGLARQILERSDAEVWVSDLVYDWAIRPQEMYAGQEAFLLDFITRCGVPAERVAQAKVFFSMINALRDALPPERVRSFPHEGRLAFGGATWQVCYAPGHCVTQSVFYQPDRRWLLSADMLLRQAPAPVIEPSLAHPEVREKALPVLMASYEKMARLEVDTVFPGHGEPFGDHRGLIQQQVERIHRRKKECLGLIQKGHHLIPELTEIMYRHLPPIAAVEGFSMLVGYLDLLMAEGLVERRADDGVWRFYAA